MHRYLLFIFILLACQLNGQQDTVLQSKIYVENANSTIVEQTEKEIVRYFNGDVRMYKDSVFMFCDSARMIGNNVTALGNVVFVQTDTIKIFCDSLIFIGNTEKAYLYENVTLENGEQKLFTESLLYDARQKIATYRDTALLETDKTILQSKEGFYDVNQKMATFYNEVVVTSENMRVRTDSLEYLTELKRALFVNPTRIVETKRKIYCEGGFYDFVSKNAEFTGNAQLIEEEDIAIADTIQYNGLDSLLTLIDNASFERPDQLAKANEIIYDFKSKSTLLKGNASFLDGEKETVGEELSYNGADKNIKITGNAVYKDGSSTLISDDLDFNEDTGKGKAKGNVTYRDSASNILIKSDELLMAEDNDLTALGLIRRPYVINILEEDSLFLAADTLHSNQLIVTDSLMRQDTFNAFQGYRKVKILKSDFTAICDSLSFNSQDSIFRLYDNPIVWSDSSQFSGDTILIHLKNKKIDRIDVINNGFIISELEEDVYNQIKGKIIAVNFKDGEVQTMDINGSAESLYFFQDDEKAYVGVNKTLCSHMTFYFLNKELEHIKFFKEPESVLTPIQQTDPRKERLKGFNWQLKNAPLNLESIIKID